MRWGERTGASDYHGNPKEFDLRDYMLKINFKKKKNPQILREYNKLFMKL